MKCIEAGFDIAAIACAAERRRHAAITSNASLVERMDQLESARVASLVQGRLGLVRRGYRVDRAITPRLAQLGEQLREALRLTQPLDVFVQPDHEHNAYCLPSRSGQRLVMGLFSGLVAALDEQELLFVMGHELGHALLRHGETVRFDFGHPLFSFLETHQLRGLARAREITCDRVGLLACQDLRVATTAMFKVASGLGDRWIDFDPAAYARHFDEPHASMEIPETDTHGDTHPPMPLRVKALLAFARSEPYARAFGSSQWDLDAVRLEEEVDAMLAAVDPDLAAVEDADEQHAANEFIRAASLLVVAADGVVSPEEIEWLDRLGGSGHGTAAEAALGDEGLLARAREELERSAQLLRQKLPEVVRADILKAMCEVAAAAGGIVEPEVQVLNELRRVLEVSVDLAEQGLREVRAAEQARGAEAPA